MYNYKVKVRIHNPEVEREVEVPMYSSYDEMLEAYGETLILAIINDHLVSLARNKARNEMIDELMRKFKHE